MPCLAVLLFAGPAAAQDSRLAGNTDLSRVALPPDLALPAGASIKGYHYWPSQTVAVLAGPFGPERPPETRTVDGSRELVFFAQADTTDQAAIVRRYRDTIESEGGGVEFQCKDSACGSKADDTGAACSKTLGWFYKGAKDPVADLISTENGADLGEWRQLFEAAAAPRAAAGTGDAAENGGPKLPTECRLLVGMIPAGHGHPQRSVSIFTTDDPATSAGHVDAVLEVADAGSASDRNAKVTAAAMASDLAAVGHTVLYGLYFDSDNAAMKMESVAALEQIAVLLRGQPALRLLVVSHTDSHGSYDAAMTLSQQRADAVVTALGHDFAIDVKRLRAVGDGMTAPLASNDTDAGSAVNRRFELVKQ